MWSLTWMDGIEIAPGRDFSSSFNVWAVQLVRIWLRMRSCLVAEEEGLGACFFVFFGELAIMGSRRGGQEKDWERLEEEGKRRHTI